MKKLLLILCLITNICFSQKTLSFDSISIMNGDTTIIKLKCKTTFSYCQNGFVLVAEDKRVYGYLLPGAEFFDFQLIDFFDTGKYLSDAAEKLKTKAVIYQSSYNHMQVAQFVYEKGIRLMKRNNTGILFY